MDYRHSVLRKISDFKSAPFSSHAIPCVFDGLYYDLVLLTSDCYKNSKIISLLAKWRKRHEHWFQATFPVTQKGTAVWFKKQVIGASDRLLFIIRVENKYIGHVGLYRFDFKNRICEIDNIIRGDKSYPGIMENAIANMMSWGRRVLRLESYGLQVMSDNMRALRLYRKLGFTRTHQVPLVKVKRGDRIEWIEDTKGEKPAKRYTVFMKKTKPMNRKKKISFAGPWITQKEIDYAIDGVRNGFYETYDQHTKKLEKAVADYLNVKYAIATHCCTLALHLATASCGLQKGDEVICTDFSWVATAYAITYTGATPVFVDIDPDTWCIDPHAIEQAVTDKTKAIMLVHSFGIPAKMDSIMEVARKHHLQVIEDAAPALGASFHGKKVGTFGDVGCFSFQGAKIAVSGEGGMFVTNNKKLYDKALLLASMGRTDSKAVFWSDMLGYQYTIANLTASLALAQVERIEELVERKRQIFTWYSERLSTVRGIKMIKESKGTKSNYCYPSILLTGDFRDRRDGIVRKLKEQNIHCRPAFPRMSRFPIFQQRFPNPEAEKAEKYGISLSSALNLDEKDIEFVCESLVSIIGNK